MGFILAYIFVPIYCFTTLNLHRISEHKFSLRQTI